MGQMRAIYAHVNPLIRHFVAPSSVADVQRLVRETQESSVDHWTPGATAIVKKILDLNFVLQEKRLKLTPLSVQGRLSLHQVVNGSDETLAIIIESTSEAIQVVITDLAIKLGFPARLLLQSPTHSFFEIVLDNRPKSVKLKLRE